MGYFQQTTGNIVTAECGDDGEHGVGLVLDLADDVL
jgi:hypothetical protein